MSHCRSKKTIIDHAPSSTSNSSTVSSSFFQNSFKPLKQQPSISKDGPKIASIAIPTWIYSEPRSSSTKLGYLRAGAMVVRAEKSTENTGCSGGWYAIQPAGYVCAGERATLDLNHPIVRITHDRQPDTSKPMPYRYGFIRSVAPQYLKVPTQEEQLQYEFKLENHLRYYRKQASTWNETSPGANEVPPSQYGKPIAEISSAIDSLENDAGSTETGLTQAPISNRVSVLELFGARSANESIPWWLEGGQRKVPHLSAFIAPKYAVIADRVRRHAGLAFIGAFNTGPESGERQFAITTDLRLIPISKLKPNVGSQWHGVELNEMFTLPIAFAYNHAKNAKELHKPIRTYTLNNNAMVANGDIPFRQAMALTGRDQNIAGTRYFETKTGVWLRKNDITIARKPDDWPTFAKGDQKWIDLSILKQTLILWEGDKPVFATLVSTGQDGMGDPKTTKSTVRGTFHIRDKHITTTMDSREVGNRFELRDVPWVQYFEAGYALHAAYWHDEYGTQRSHGCVNLSPIDARRVFLWTDPPVPPGWHAVMASDQTGKGTIVYSHI